MQADFPILGLLEAGEGRIAVYGDSNCLDSSHMVTNCYWLLRKILDFTSANIRDPILFTKFSKRNSPLYLEDSKLPSRRSDVNFSLYSAVARKELICRSDSRFEVWGTKGYSIQVRGRNRRLPGFPVIDLGRGLNSTSEGSSMGPPKSSSKDRSDTYGNRYLSLFYRDEVRLNFPVDLRQITNIYYFINMILNCSSSQPDMPLIVPNHWLVPAVVALTGHYIFLVAPELVSFS